MLKQWIIIGMSVFMVGGWCLTASSCSDDDTIQESAGNGDNGTEETDVKFLETCQTIMDRIKADHARVSVNDSKIEEYLGLMQQNGGFSDVDYSDTSYDWKPVTHLNRLKEMAQAYICEASRYFGDEELHTAIVKALTHWNTVHPVCDNWFENQIRSPKLMGETLILLRYGRRYVPEELESSIFDYWTKTGGHPSSQGLGSNKSDIATHWLYRGVLQQSKHAVETAAYHLFRSLEYVNPDEEGIQHDLSIFQHGTQLYIGGYGVELLKGVTQAGVHLAGTEYAMNSIQRQLLYRFVNETFMGSIRGRQQFYNVVGRSVSRENSINRNSSVTILERMKLIDAEHTSDYEFAIATLKGEAGYEQITKRLNHYYIADYMSVQAPRYAANVRMSSTRTSKIEHGNDENLKSFFMSDGCMDIAIQGDEYLNIFPVWDWCRVPGVTNPQMREIPLAKGWGIKGESTFTGGVSDGQDGLSAFHMIYNSYNVDMNARKSYFFMDDKIVCLGSGITSKMAEEINTTVNQCLKKTEVWYAVAGQENRLSGAINDLDLDWVWHRDIGYFFPGKELVSVKEEKRSGKWKDINHLSGSTKTVSEDVCTVWFNHGRLPVAPKNTYCYVIVPNIGQAQMKSYNNMVKVIANTPELQAVSNKDASTVQAVFYQAGNFILGNLTVTVNQPCALMIKKAGEKEYRLFFSDPARKLKSLRIRLEQDGQSKEYMFDGFNMDNAYKGITHQTSLAL